MVSNIAIDWFPKNEMVITDMFQAIILNRENPILQTTY